MQQRPGIPDRGSSDREDAGNPYEAVEPPNSYDDLQEVQALQYDDQRDTIRPIVREVLRGSLAEIEEALQAALDETEAYLADTGLKLSLSIQPCPKPKDRRLNDLPALSKALKEQSAGIGGKIPPHRPETKGEKQYACDVCDRKFTQKRDLVIHSRGHTGEKPFECSLCPATFASSQYRKKHMLTHTGDRLHECSVCGRRLATETILARHALTHSGKKAFACHVCGRKFSRTDALRVHARTHTGEKLYTCHLCPASFAHLVTLKNHVASHTVRAQVQTRVAKRKQQLRTEDPAPCEAILNRQGERKRHCGADAANHDAEPRPDWKVGRDFRLTAFAVELKAMATYLRA
ncbi:zinc finger protein 771-like [Rhipicephalus sanguineus]|uniref:zinc finger protein 771-like n=1 Tax=Rhipicephalus sanguineus TaxID=34632 RepID=UPI0018949D52|nr:zinc finger protein 771-like [Rhipicephalus sanguineus]